MQVTEKVYAEQRSSYDLHLHTCWSFDARAVTLVRAIGFDAACLRGKCEEDHDLGYALMMQFAPRLWDRLRSTRLQLADIYGKPSG